MRKLGTKHVESGKACAYAVTALCSRLILLFVAFAVFFPTQGRAQVACTPDAGYTTCRAYTYTGADQGVTVPGSITSIKVKAWGAGAGGSVLAASNIGAPGGSGGYVEGVLAVTPGSQYVVMTGRGGGADGTAGSSANCSAAYGFGGACAPARGGSYSDGGGGGGLAGLFTGSTPVTATDNARAVFVAGGAGAGEGTNACGNTSAAGGAGGNSFAGAMSTMQGINGAFSGGANPTGGGGGYHGGDGTTRLRNGTCVASANGGSNFIAGAGTSATVNLPGNEAPSVPNFTVKNPPSTTEPQYIAGVGVGQLALAVVGGNGLVVLQWADPILSVSKTATPNPFVSGQPASYAVTIQNTGAASTFGNITISDTLPTGVTLASASGANWSCSGTTALTCTFTGVLAIGDSTTLTLNVDVSNSAVNGNNTATASGGADPTCPAAAHCTGSVTVPINTTYVCSPSTIFVTQNTPAQLFSETYGSGSATFNPIGPASAWNYNSAGYRAADNYIYAVSAALDAAHPVNHLLRIDPATGAVADVGAITGLPASGVNSGAFDASDNYYVGFNTATSIYRINLTTRVATAIALTPSAQLQIADWTFASGFLWGVTNNAQSITRVNPTTGAIARYAVTILPVASGYGAAWTFGNGNLGFGNNDTGAIYQVRVATPAGTPTFTLVSSSPGPLPSVANDGTSCISAPADLGITKTGPASSSAGGALSWTLTVTNNGAGLSSGFTVVDAVPAGVTGIASPTPGCTVAGSTVTCVEGALAVGGTFNITVNGNAPNPFTAAITNTATVTGNESDSVAGNNTATETVTPLNPTLTVTKTATPASFVVGQPASYAITVQNTGTGPTTASFTITDTLPAGITFASAAGTSWSCAGTTTLTCTFSGTLAAGGSTVLTLNVNVTAAAVNGDNSATARGGGDPTCPASGAPAAHCSDSVTVPINTQYICSPSTIFVAQGTPTQLNAETYGSGGAVFTPIGTATWSYNAIGYRASDNFIYATSGNLDAAHPINHLLRIDPSNGVVADLGVITGAPAAGVNNGTFDAAGNYYIASGSDTTIYRVNLATRVATAINLTPSQALGIADFAPASGYLWNITTSSSPPTMTRVNPANGAIARFAIPAMPIVTATGAAWTFGNGNLGFSDNTTGNVYQIRVTNPTGTPTFALVSQSPGPTSGQNDGTSCVSPPIDLAIAKTGPASAAPNGAISWSLSVTNNGPAISSGYTVVDTVPAGVTNITSPTPGCTVAGNTVTCVGGQLAVGASFAFTVNGNAPTPFNTAITNTATVTGNETDPVLSNNTATETVTPLPPANVSVAKALTGESGSIPGVAEPGEQLTYTITLSNSGGLAATNYSVTDPLDPNVTFVSASNGGSLAGSVVTWNGLTVPAGGNLALTIVVAVNNPIPSGVTRVGNVAYQTGTSPPNCSGIPQPANCTVTPTAPHITVAKTAGSPVPTGNPNEYRITYVATVTNNGGSVGTYDLSDTLTFNGATVNAISAPVYASSTGDTRTGALGTLTPPSGGTIVTGESLSASGIETWTYAVTYQVTDPATAEDCSVPSGGLRNSAALGGAASGAPSADTCSGAPNVTILKTAAAPVATGTPNQFTVTYTVNVLNTGTLIGVYDLADTLDFNGATVNAISAPAYSSSSGDTQDGTLGLFGAPNGGTIVDDETISAGGAETWTYTATYTVTDAVAAQNCADPAGGLRNSAELGGSLNGESTTCTGAPAVVIGKSVSGPTPTGNPNEYTLLYQVTVQNNGTLDGTYDLSDTFTFPGVSGVVVSSVSHGGADPLATPLGTLTASGGTIVTGETIAAGASETYTYSVVFTIDDVVAVGNCALGGGLVNNAALGGSSSGQVSTCSGVPDIAVDKTAASPVATGAPNQYSITYTVIVTNIGEAAGTYDLADTFAFAGASVDTVSAIAHGGTDPLITTLGTLSPSGGTIVTDEPIAGSGNETYTYTVTYTITDSAAANDCASPSGGLRNSASLGGSVSGDAGTCTGSPIVAVAKALSGESGTQPGIAEPGEQLTYTITMTNAGSVAATNQSIVDTLDPNVAFVSADNGGTVVGGDVEWTGLTVPAGSNLLLTVVVSVNAPIPPGVTQIGNVAYDPAEPPPNCGTDPLPPNCVVIPTPDPIDFGDAPDTYGTLLASNGARHAVPDLDIGNNTASLMLGTTIDTEPDGLPGAGADGDDLNGIDDEDAFFGPIALQPGATSVSLDVPVTNATAGNANLYAWIDFNGNGAFDTVEAGSCPVVPAGATSVTCTWTGLTALVDGFQSFARFRITTQTLAPGTAPNGGDARAQGSARDGEVEDHPVTVATVLPLTCEAPFVETFGSYPVTPGAAPGFGPALPAGTTTYGFQPGPAYVGAGQYALVTQPILGNPAWQPVPDHTPGDTDGFMMIVNGDPAPGVFYRHTFSGLSIGARYNFFASLANIVAGFNLGLPDVTLRIVDPATNAVLVSIDTGGIPEGPSGAMPWLQQQLIFTASQSEVRVELVNNSGVQGGNDLGLDDIGFAQVCELGDAPDSYGTLNASNGAGNLFPGPGLSLGGGLPDGEDDGQPSVNADGDDLNGIDDENAFPGGAPQLVVAAPYVLNVPVETTAGDATACAWVDLDQNGSFSAAEGQCQSLAAGATTANFAWTAAATAGLSSGRTYLRLRIERNGTFPTNLSTADFLGVRGPGEVEDYVVQVLTPANVTVAKALTGESGTQAGIAEPGETLTYTITLTNSGGVDALNYQASDQLDPNTTFVSASNGGTPTGGVVNWTGLTVPANGTLALTVVVTVNTPIPPDVTQLGNVAYQTGTTPPSCPPASPQCVITPTAASVTIAKALTAESGTQPGIAEPGEQLTYTITLTNGGGSDALNYVASDRLDPNTTFVSASNGGTVTAGVVNWTGLTVPVNGTLTLTVVVSVNSPIPPGVTQIGNVAYETGTTPPSCPPAGPQCVITPTAASVSTVKLLSGESGSQAGIAEPGEQLTYSITLTNTGGSAALNYAETDRLDPNTTFVSASNGGAFSAGVVNWTGLTVPAGGSLTLTVVVSVNSPIPPGVTQIGNVAYQTGTTPPSCPPGGPQCVIVPTAAAVAIGKTASAPTPTGTPNEYQITYVATATNSGGSVGNYDLSDTLTFNGATVTAITAPAYASSTGDTQTGVLGSLTPPSGGTIVTGESLNASGIETWTYTVTYQITDPATASDCSVPNGGLRNSAALGGAASGAPPAATCTGAPSVSIRKTAGAPVATGSPNEFTLTYTVDVANTGTLGGVYDLADALDFNGANVTAISAPAYSSSTGDTQDGTLGTFTAPNGGTIVTDEAISTGGAERWTYTVTYTVTDSAVAQDCTSPNGGLRNDAALGGSLSGESTTCTGAPAVVIGKSASGPVATGSPNEYKLTYLVTVQNNGTLPGVYDLDDSFAFPGVTVVSVGPVVHGGVDPLSTPLGTLTPTGGNIVTGESIAAHASETYTYNVVFTVDDVAAVGSCASGGGLVNQASLGGSSAGEVGTCSGVPDVAIVKTASAPASTGTPNQYTITYTVTVDNAGDASGTYDLADAFTFAGATVNAVSAITHGGPDPLITALGTLTTTGGTIVTGEPIGAGSSETYAYTVTFTITDAATANDCTNPAGGLRNAATLGGSATGESDTCTGSAIVTTAKALSSESGTQPGIAEPGETLTYTITLTNSGSVDATNQSIVDPLDANVTFVSADNGGALAGGNVTWNGLTVPANGNLVLTVVVTVANPIPAGVTEIGNVAYDPNVGQPDCTTTPTPPNCTITPTEADVAIAKVLSGESGTQPGVAEPGEQLTYTITLTNTGGSDAINYSATDTLDPNVTFVSADNGGALVGGNVVWNGLTVPAGGNLVLTVIVSVNATIPPGVTQIGNVAYETGTTPPTCPPAGPQCVVIPTAGSVTIAKSVVDANGDGVAQAGEQLTYAITLTNGGGSNVANYAVTDPLDPNVVFVSASNGGAFAGGVVTWTGLTVPANGNLVLTVVVTVVNPIPPGVTAIGNVAYQTGGSPPDCSAVPTPANCSTIPTDAQISIGKTASAPAPTGVPNQYRLTYTATVSNTGGSAGNYSLSDTLTFNGATVTAISAPTYGSSTGDTQDGTLGTFAPPSGGVIVTGEDLSIGGIETWTYTVTYTITDADLASDCSSALGGLRNRAALGGSNVFGPPAQTCTGASSVAIQKTAAAPVPTGNPNEFTLTYTVNVSNAGSLVGVYDLSDVLTFNGANITAISAPAYSSSTGDTQDGTLGAFGLPDGGIIVSGENIAAGGAETWTYTVTYSITDAATADDCADPNGGLRNSAALGGAMSGQSTTCTGAPAVSIGKSASGPTATGNPNEYTLTYLVAVQNNGTLTGNYDLSDTFTLPGTSNVSVSAIQHNGPDPLATTLGTLLPSGGTIVTGETIAAGSSESYTYTVTFTIDAAAVGDCATGGGLINDAELGGSSAGQVGTCSDVPNVAIAKSATTPTPTGTPNQYAMTYTVTASNTGFAVGTYDLADTFTFAGATIDAVSAVTHGGPDPLATTLGTLTAAGGTIVTGESVAAGSSETYTYTVTFTVTDPASANDCTDPNGGLRNAATLGGSATGSSATCNGAPSVTMSKVLSGESGSVPGVAEPGEQLTYTITLTNAGAVDQTNYGVTDPLDPNVTFVSASNGGTLTGGSVIWSGLTVPAGGNLVLTVVVTVNDPIPAGVTTIGNVAYQTGGTPPDCTATPTPPNCVITPAEGVVAIVKSVADANGNNIAEPGETLTYTITLTNTNGGDVTGYGVTDPLDANVTFVSASNGGTFAGGTVTWTGLAIPANSSLALTVVVTVDNPLPPGVTQIGNVAYETGGTPPDCTVNPRPANCTVIVTPSPGTITIVKTVADANGNSLAEPGETLTYTITLTNTNGGDVTGYGVTDPLDANTTFVSASNGGAFAGGTVTWTNLTIPANSSVALTVVATVNNPLPPGVTQIGNLAYETGTTPPDCTTNPRPANCAVIVTPPPGTIAIAKSVVDANGNHVAEPGETLTYTITLTNSGGDVTNYGITDPLDANVVFVSADNGGTFAGGVVSWTNLTIPANGSLALTVMVTVANPIPAGVTEIGNVAYQTGGTPPDCTAVPQPPSCAVIVTPPPAGTPELLIQKAVNTTSTTPGGTLIYTVTVSNVGTAAATNAVITDPIPIGVARYAWTCAASGGAVCPNASGTGGIAETIATFPPGGVIVYTVTAQLEANPPATIANVASVTPPGLGTCAPSGTPPPCSSTVIVGVNPPVGGEPQPVPALNEWALLLLGLATLGVAWRATASNRRG